MRFPTEYRIYVDQRPDIYDIINGECVVNINLTNYKEVKTMLENEKTFRLEQLNSLKGVYEKKLADLQADNIDAVVKERVAEFEAKTRAELVADNEKAVAKVTFQIEAIDEMIADVEAVEVETESPVDEVENEEVSNENQTEF